ncbi:cysteine desulfurase NifS [Vibrio hangzhouensis]|uniref:Cysteine desulfurase n=1 Tax=Vibrio hangzhouensis TaxID=462991 RepID=A0A1H5TGQ2_9VIBR|nr:cysteine desulfurase NifS [Vibrio hangzhouensis]SEF61989.1 cysteine desulfurase [Vibrio hangzhouensis]
MHDLTKELVYLDNNATTRVDPEVLSSMMPYLEHYYGNPSSIHALGAQVGKSLQRAREQVQSLIGAQYSSEIVFTSCATEATTTAILSAIEATPDRKTIITSRVEHPATLELCQNLERKGYKIVWVGVDNLGEFDFPSYIKALNDDVAIVSIMWANNETGTIFPVEKIASAAKTVNAQVHIDAVQAVGKIPVDVSGMDIDMLSLSGHKFHAPKGIGALYLRRGTRFRPLMRGGHQERGRRAGTENAAGIIALGKAAELAAQSVVENTNQIAMLRDRLEHGILARIPNTFVTGSPSLRVPNTTNIAVEYIEGEALLLLLNQQGIAASSGSACTSGSLEPSHVMKAMDIPFTAAHGTLRFSLSKFTSDSDVDRVLDVLPSIVERLRQLSPYWDSQTGQPIEDSFVPAYA